MGFQNFFQTVDHKIMWTISYQICPTNCFIHSLVYIFWAQINFYGLLEEFWWTINGPHTSFWETLLQNNDKINERENQSKLPVFLCNWFDSSRFDRFATNFVLPSVCRVTAIDWRIWTIEICKGYWDHKIIGGTFWRFSDIRLWLPY